MFFGGNAPIVPPVFKYQAMKNKKLKKLLKSNLLPLPERSLSTSKLKNCYFVYDGFIGYTDKAVIYLWEHSGTLKEGLYSLESDSPQAISKDFKKLKQFLSTVPQSYDGFFINDYKLWARLYGITGEKAVYFSQSGIRIKGTDYSRAGYMFDPPTIIECRLGYIAEIHRFTNFEFVEFTPDDYRVPFIKMQTDDMIVYYSTCQKIYDGRVEIIDGI